MINFDKMHGNGNDFIVINSIENTHKLSKSKLRTYQIEILALVLIK